MRDRKLEMGCERGKKWNLGNKGKIRKSGQV